MRTTNTSGATAMMCASSCSTTEPSPTARSTTRSSKPTRRSTPSTTSGRRRRSGFSRENSLILVDGGIRGDYIVKMAQNYRSGTSDVYAIDFVELFLADEEETNIDA